MEGFVCFKLMQAWPHRDVEEIPGLHPRESDLGVVVHNFIFCAERNWLQK